MKKENTLREFKNVYLAALDAKRRRAEAILEEVQDIEQQRTEWRTRNSQISEDISLFEEMFETAMEGKLPIETEVEKNGRKKKSQES